LDLTKMPNLAAELYAVQHLAALGGLNITNIADATSVLGPTERGLDVVFDLGGRRIGAQHTIYHGDEGHYPGKRGSLGRANEEAIARRTQAPFGMWGVGDYRPALALRLQEKCAIALDHDNRDLVAESWLVVSACLPRWGAAASTMMLPAFVRVADLNALSHEMLCASPFERAYLVLHMGSVVFGWNRREGWRIVADPDAGERERHRDRMNDLIFNQIPAHHRRQRMAG
jgi:hypothetical protein